MRGLREKVNPIDDAFNMTIPMDIVGISFEDILPMRNFCCKHYDTETFKHARRVALYAVQNPLSKELFFPLRYPMDMPVPLSRELVYCMALAHDLIEDTGVSIDDVVTSQLISHWDNLRVEWDVDVNYLKNTLELLTHSKDISYETYCRRIKESNNSLAYVIKLADMKDHLAQKDTLTDRLREKYLNALPILL